MQIGALGDLLMSPLWGGVQGQAVAPSGAQAVDAAEHPWAAEDRLGGGSGRQRGLAPREGAERDLPGEPHQGPHMRLPHSALRPWRTEDSEPSECDRYDDLLQALYGVGLTLEAALHSAQQADLRVRLEQALSDLDGPVGRCYTA